MTAVPQGRMVTGYWDMAASLVTFGAINADMFRTAHTEIAATVSKLHPFLSQLREKTGVPEFFLTCRASSSTCRRSKAIGPDARSVPEHASRQQVAGDRPASRRMQDPVAAQVYSLAGQEPSICEQAFQLLDMQAYGTPTQAAVRKLGT
jgi:hypothetical protein